MRYFTFFLFLTLVVMSHVIQAAPSLNIKPKPVEFSNLEPNDRPPGPLKASVLKSSEYQISLGAYAGNLFSSDNQDMGGLLQGEFHNWLRVQITDSNVLGVQVGFDVPCNFRFCESLPQKIFIGSYLRGSDQLANFIDYTRFKFIFSINLFHFEISEVPLSLHADFGYGYLGYVASLFLDWRF